MIYYSLKFAMSFFALCAIISCKAQIEVELKINNFSAYKIDSIVSTDKGLNKVLFQQNIEPNQSTTIKLTFDKSELWYQGAFNITVYTTHRIWTGSWGFHDMGYINSYETINVYDNGLSYGKVRLIKPEEFTVFLYNQDKTRKIDSIASSVNIKEVKENSPRSREIIFYFDKLKRKPEFAVWISGKKYQPYIEYDFEDWNNNREFLYFYDGQFTRKSLNSGTPLEFRISFIKPKDLEILKIEDSCHCLTGIYSYKGGFTNLIFDYDQFRKKPIFEIKTNAKNFFFDLSSINFTFIYDGKVNFKIQEIVELER